MLETVVMVLAVGLLGTILVGGLVTVMVGFGAALSESVQIHADHPRHSGRIPLSHQLGSERSAARGAWGAPYRAPLKRYHI